MIIDDLRQHTKEQHRQLDQALYPHIQQVHTTNDYAKLLASFHGFFNPMQIQFDQFLNEQLLPDYNNRRKPHWILEDLQSLQLPITDLPNCASLPDIHSIPTAFGAFYVLEGSTMGGTIITKKLSENLHLTPPNHLRFFYGYGEANKKMWNFFLDTMENIPENHEKKPALLDAAKNTFTKFSQWLTQCYG